LLFEWNVCSVTGIGTVPRWKKICVTIGKPLSFSATTNDRTGWESIAAATENAVRALATLP
jgi:hypothetical protein